MDASVAVVGGGLAGLVAARRLASRGTEVTLFEREEGVGGRVRSTREDGFTFDRGFQVLFTAYPAAKRELDYDALDLRRFKPGAVLARPGKRSVLSDPLRDLGGLAESVANTEVSTRDKLRTLGLRRRLARADPESFFDGGDQSIRAALLERGFSERFVENFAAPFYGGITLDRSLSTSQATFDYTFATLARGSIAVPADGMGAIPRQLADAAREAGATIETGTAVDAVETDGAGGATVVADGESVGADAVVVAADPRSARELSGVGSIPTDGRGCVTQWYSLDGDLETGRRLLLNVASEAPNHVVDHTAVAPEYAPDGRTLLSATFLGNGGAPGSPDADVDRSDGRDSWIDGDDNELAALTREKLASWYPERSVGSLSLLHTDRIPFAQFAQPPGFYADLPDVRAPGEGVYLAGDYTEWSSIQGAMRSGARAADAVAEDLG
jgi:phytoene dehydrogenase-like protein